MRFRMLQNRRTCRRISSIRPGVLGGLAGILALFQIGSVWAQPPAGSPLAQGYGLVIALPGADADLADAAIRSASGDFAGAPAEAASLIDVADVRLTTPLRRAIFIDRLATDGPEGTGPCSIDLPDFALVVSQLEEALTFLNFKVARDRVALADRAFACDQGVVTRETIARYYLLVGLLESYQTNDDRGLFRQAARLEAENLPLEMLPQRSRAVYDRARGDAGSGKRVEVERPADLAELEVSVDGKALEAGRHVLLAGPHFVQVSSFQGVIAGTIAEIAEGAGTKDGNPGGRIVLVPPPALQPPTAEDIQTQIQEAGRLGRLSPPLQAALLGLLRTGSHPWLVVLVPESGIMPAYALWLSSSGQTQRVTLSTAVSKLGIATSSTLGAVGLVGLGALGVWLGNAVFEDQCPDAFCVKNTREFYFGVGIAGGVAVVSGTLGAVVASRTWKVPRRLYPHQRFLEGGTLPTVKTTAGPGRLALELRW